MSEKTPSPQGGVSGEGAAPDHPLAQEPDTSENPSPSKSPARKRPDWQPLGSVRDYFNEQIKQEQRRW